MRTLETLPQAFIQYGMAQPRLSLLLFRFISQALDIWPHLQLPGARNTRQLLRSLHTLVMCYHNVLSTGEERLVLPCHELTRSKVLMQVFEELAIREKALSSGMISLVPG